MVGIKVVHLRVFELDVVKVTKVGLNWKPMSARGDDIASDELLEGVPGHLVAPLVYWIQGTFGYRATRGTNAPFMFSIANAARIPVNVDVVGVQLQDDILRRALSDSNTFLDCLDAILHFGKGKVSASELKYILELGGSAWTVSSDGVALQRRVSEAAQLAAAGAMAARDIAAEELREGWRAAFGRNPNASDAWDHAIKAVEAALIPVVVPKQDKAPFGHVLGRLKSNGSQWKRTLPGAGENHEVDPLAEILGLLWPNPDCHPNGKSRPPALDEAKSVLHLAITVVEWQRIGLLSKRNPWQVGGLSASRRPGAARSRCVKGALPA